jgi:aminopeptidase N
LGITRTNNIHLFKVEMGNGICDEYVDVRKRYTEGIYGTATHELGHSWFQHVLASNESKHPWMDEGFTTYVSDLAENEFALKKWQTLRRKL